MSFLIIIWKVYFFKEKKDKEELGKTENDKAIS